MRSILLWSVLALGAAAAGGAWYLRPRELCLAPSARVPVWEWRGGRPAVSLPGSALLASTSRFADELYAYLHFDYLRSRPALRPAEILLTYRRQREEVSYPIVLHLNNDLLAGIAILEDARRRGYLDSYEWRFAPPPELAHARAQSRVFHAAYNLPVQRSIERLSPAEKLRFLRRFILLKSRTDPRVRRGMQPAPEALSAGEAGMLAADILTVSEFFELPLEFFLGIGAMENNYMDVPGDLDHAVWKSRAERGDIVLRRRRGRVLVLNPSAGVWQITRETLRYAHRLYLKDERDYSRLPPHLVPERKLNLDEIAPARLTTYAGLLLRDLLDRFEGDVAKAIGAYNGGPGNPNMQYEEGVRLVAAYARRMLEQSARLNGESVASIRFLAPPR